MQHEQLTRMLDTRISRRSALQATGAVGLAGALASQGIRFAVAQDATPDVIDLPDLAITAVDFSYDLPASVEAGWTHVSLDNQGMMDHHAMFLRPHEGSTVEDVQAALQQGDFGAIFAVASSAGGPNVGPGHQASVVMNLEAGQYVLICVIPNEEGIPHFALGMQAVLEVTESAAEGTPPEADATIELMEMMFHGIGDDITAGHAIWNLTNVGEQVHEMVVLQLAPGITGEQAVAMLSGTSAATPEHQMDMGTPAGGAAPAGPPFVAIGGAAPMSPDVSNLAVLDLTAGEYVAICFVPDPATGAPHFALGMIAPFTVA